MKEEFIFNTLCKFYTSSKFELKKISVEKDCSYSCYEYLEDNFYDSVYFKYCSYLKHPNLPFFEKNIFTDDFKCSLYRCISGEILSKRLRRNKRLSVNQSINIISGIVNALKYIQNFNNDLVYLNLNIDSIFIEQSNEYEKSILISLENIIDKNDYQFDEKDFNELNFIYTHPNIINGNIGVAYTIYSLCSILYELLFGITPFHKYKFNKKLSIYGNFSELKKFLSHTVVDFFYQTEDLIKILSKGLMLYPKNYYRSYDDFLTDLHSLSKTKEELSSYREVKHQLDYVKSNNVGLASIVGFNDLKEQLKSDIIDVIRDSENARRFGINMPNGILFYGPPGCGKTFFAEKLAEETGFYFQYIRCSDIACPYIHGGQTKIAEIFETAKKHKKSILFFDEVDAMMTDRAKINTSSEAGEVNEFLTQINNCSEFGIIVIAATNKPEMIDSAILRSGRIELKFYISEPDYATRIQLFLEYVKNRNVNKNIDYNFLARLTDNYVTADIKLIVDTAARFAFRQKKEFIEQNDFVNAIEKVKPSVSIQELNRYKLCFDNYTMEC